MIILIDDCVEFHIYLHATASLLVPTFFFINSRNSEAWNKEMNEDSIFLIVTGDLKKHIL